MADRATRERLKKITSIIQRLDWLKSIMMVHLRIGTILELDKISRIYLRELIDIVGCDGAAIIRVDGDKARILAERGFSPTFGTQEIVADIPTIKYLVSTKNTILTGDIINSPFAGYIPRVSSINSLLCVPVLVNNEVRGVIHMDSLKKDAFTEEDVEFTDLLATELSFSLAQSLDYDISQNPLVVDQVTGCLNRDKFDLDIVVDIASAKEYQENLSLLLIEIDSFGKYREAQDTAKGDILLKRLVSILSFHTRPYEKLYHYDAGEFITLMPETDKRRALLVAERLRQTIEQAQFEGETESRQKETVTVSIGVATFPSDASNRDKLIAVADTALGRAKEAGGNQVVGYKRSQLRKE